MDSLHTHAHPSPPCHAQAHADHLEEAVRRQPSPNRHTVVQAQKYLAKARSLEAAAAAHSLQARAVVHAESRAQMELLARDCAQQATQQRLNLAMVAEHQQQQVSAIGTISPCFQVHAAPIAEK